MFGENILSVSPIDWIIENGSIRADGVMELQADGYAIQTRDEDDISGIPDEMYLSIVANKYTNSQEPTAFAIIKVQSAAGVQYEYSIPLIDTGNGFCTVTFPTTRTSYTALSLTIRSQEAVNITSWILSGPVVDRTILEDIRQEIPRLLDDYNTASFAVAQEEVTIGLITAELLEKTDLNGHVLISYISNVATTLTIRIKDNTITELYTPVIYNITPGRNAIGIPHAYLKKFSGIHTFAVTAQVDIGTITLFTRGLLYTIDGAYLAKRLMDIDIEIADITIMQLDTDASPSRIFAVSMEDGMARVRHRPIEGGTGVTWEPSYEVGPAVNACIEFDGDWVRRGKAGGYTLITENLPWVAWIAPDKTLYAQRGLDVNTQVVLSTEVDSISMVRGFKSLQTLEDDQGIIVLYVKNGSLFYRNYCNQATTVALWELEQQITEAGNDVISAHIGRLNDYRIGVSVSALSSNKFFITSRIWAGMASPAENVATGIKDLKFEVTQIIYQDTYGDEHLKTTMDVERFYVCPAGIVPEIVDVKRLSFADKKTLQLTFNYELECELANLKASLSVKNKVGQPFTVDTVTASGKILTIKTAEVMAPTVDVTLEYSMVESYYLAFRISDACLYGYGKLISLNIVGVPPVGFAKENVAISIPDLSFAVTQVYPRSVEANENVSVGITSASVDVIKVGSNPL